MLKIMSMTKLKTLNKQYKKERNMLMKKQKMSNKLLRKEDKMPSK